MNFWKDFIAYRKCNICQQKLLDKEQCLCTGCTAMLCESLHSSAFFNDTNNFTARLFWGNAPIERAKVLFVYHPGEGISHLLQCIKYKEHSDTCYQLGCTLGAHLLEQGFLEGIDLIVPVPLSKQRRRKRGYNQSEGIAEGISHLSHIPLDRGGVERHIDNRSQTRLSLTERRANVRGIFRVAHPERFEGKHILIIDDIITTGATVSELILTIAESAPHAIFSVSALGRGAKLPDKH